MLRLVYEIVDQRAHGLGVVGAAALVGENLHPSPKRRVADHFRKPSDAQQLARFHECFECFLTDVVLVILADGADRVAVDVLFRKRRCESASDLRAEFPAEGIRPDAALLAVRLDLNIKRFLSERFYIRRVVAKHVQYDGGLRAAGDKRCTCKAPRHLHRNRMPAVCAISTPGSSSPVALNWRKMAALSILSGCGMWNSAGTSASSMIWQL